MDGKNLGINWFRMTKVPSGTRCAGSASAGRANKTHEVSPHAFFPVEKRCFFVPGIGTIEVETRAHFFETDAMQVVHHANHIRWFEMARVEYLRARGVLLKDLMDQGILFPVRDVYCQYKEPARYDDIVIIRAEVPELTKVKMEFTYTILRKADQALLATGRTTTVFTGLTGRITKLPDHVFEQLRR